MGQRGFSCLGEGQSDNVLLSDGIEDRVAGVLAPSPSARAWLYTSFVVHHNGDIVPKNSVCVEQKWVPTSIGTQSRSRKGCLPSGREMHLAKHG